MKKPIITILFAIVALMGLAQTKTATITGYSPAKTAHWCWPVLVYQEMLSIPSEVDDSPSRYQLKNYPAAFSR